MVSFIDIALYGTLFLGFFCLVVVLDLIGTKSGWPNIVYGSTAVVGAVATLLALFGLLFRATGTIADPEGAAKSLVILDSLCILSLVLAILCDIHRDNKAA